MLHVYYSDQKITYNKYCFLFKWQGGEGEGFIDLARGAEFPLILCVIEFFVIFIYNKKQGFINFRSVF